jgi:XTP/dITP diphosphohydrolase
MKELIFATANEHKAIEIRQILDLKGIKILTLKDIGYDTDIAETGDTMTANALIKSQTIYELYDKNVFSDDSGLEIEALDMAPGLYSARYAGPQRDSDDNIDKVLLQMKDCTNRKARFRSVIALIWEGEKYTYEGIVDGTITDRRQGVGGFGYDPIFIPEGYDQSFAELGDDIKNQISHRYNALVKMKSFIDSIVT